MTMELILIRHGATLANAERRYMGQATDQPLSERGKRELVDRKSRGLYPTVDALYVSPLNRCVETARVLYPMLVPTTLISLAELDFGSFEGKTYDQLKDDPSYRLWIDTKGMVAPPGGESGQDFTARLRGSMRHIADDSKGRGIRKAAVVTHGGCIMALIAQLHPLASQGIDMYDYQTSNGGGYRITMNTESIIFESIKTL